jgi:hypothetical protein
MWNPDDFRRRRTNVVRVGGEATSGGIAEEDTTVSSPSISLPAGIGATSKLGGGGGGGLASVVNALRLEYHLSSIHGAGTVPRGVINIIGASDMLDRFVAGEVEGKMGELPDGISPEEAIARLMMVFSRGICAAAGAADLPAIVVTGGFDVGPSVGRVPMEKAHARGRQGEGIYNTTIIIRSHIIYSLISLSLLAAPFTLLSRL